MRQQVTLARIQMFMKALGAAVTSPSRVYLVGGATAVLFRWRDSTIDLDRKIIPESDEIFRNLPLLKEHLQMNMILRINFTATRPLTAHLFVEQSSASSAKPARETDPAVTHRPGKMADFASSKAAASGDFVETRRRFRAPACL